ncbi:MAG: DUF1501 domain-containing protein [Planctomycetaceae bacterium]
MTPDARPPARPLALPRRDLLARGGLGMGLLGLAGVLGDSGAAVRAPDPLLEPLAPKAPHFRARATRVVHVFLNGGPSQVDTFDPKPALARHADAPAPRNLTTERKTGAPLPSPFAFARHGESGLEISEIFPRIAAHADRLAVIRSMHAQVPNHEPSLMLMNCGDSVQPRPSVGSWILYGLGTENRNLPGFVAMCPGGHPVKGPDNWQSGFLPGSLQGTAIDSQHTEIARLIENITSPHASPEVQRRQLDWLLRANAAHREGRADPRLDARIHSFEMAFRMQAEAADAFDVTRETAATRALYGDSVHGRQTLIARRLLERGVRYVQLWHGAGQPWDNHEQIESNHRTLAGQIDQPVAALLADLADRGMLDDTLVLFGGEFGRTPTVELGGDGTAKAGRDHNHYGFSVWLAGGGIKGGQAYGATDDFGFKAVEHPVSVHDLHATMLHLLGFDHERLTFRYAGRDFRLTDVSGRVITELLA